MNKKVLKDFAVYARNELRNQISLRAKVFGITEKLIPTIVTGTDYVEVNGNKYPVTYKQGIEKLLAAINTKGYDTVIEEVAYTWFNRLIAIRFMEVHNYLPSKVRVLSSETMGKVDPDILTEYQYTNLLVNKEEIASLLATGKREEAFRKLLIGQCNELNEIMPFLFERLADFTELLLPESLLHSDSLINKLGKELEDENFKHVEVIGWLYQYYISEKKDEVFAGLKKNKKITKENIPAATQLFTPHWIVRYMVDNSLGQMWLESYPDSNLRNEMKYYIKPEEQNADIQDKLLVFRSPNLSPEDITIFDPACGSGHVLVYAFDLLYKIYEERGYSAKEIPSLILGKNLFGIDIDDRAAQLASFALLMKAREKTKRIFRDLPKLNIISIQESNRIRINETAELIGESESEKIEIKNLLSTYIDAKIFGSILQPEETKLNKFVEKVKELKKSGEITLENYDVFEQLDDILRIFEQSKILTNQYDVVITNPPYMSSKGMNPNLNDYARNHYANFKSDLFSIFINRCWLSTKKGGFNAYMTPMVWMFIKSYEELRKFILNKYSIHSLIQLHYDAFTAASVPICTFVLRNNHLNYQGNYIRLTEFYGENLQPKKVLEAIINPKVEFRFVSAQENFIDIPGFPIAYWASDRIREIFKKNRRLEDIAEPRQGLATADNNRFLRRWYEVSMSKIGLNMKNSTKALESAKKWFPYNKGGDFRKWYGNQEYVINWENDGRDLKNFKPAVIRNPSYYFKESITWSFVSSAYFGVRYSPGGFIFDVGGSSLFPDSKEIKTLTGLLSSRMAHYFLSIMNPTLNFQVGNIANIPIPEWKDKKNEIDFYSEEAINISKADWDSFETSWYFTKHPLIHLIGNNKTLEQCFKSWLDHTETQFLRLQQIEEWLNRTFIELYGLNNELSPIVPDDEVTIHRADRLRDTKSFLSYFIGLLMGRYSLDIDGLTFAGGTWDSEKYKSFQPDSDGIIPLTETEYFEDDVVTQLQELLILLFGQDTLAENLRWLAESLTLKANETPVERIRRYFFDEFYSDHCKLYQKRPIYWLAESGTKKGFRSLFYLHRYTPETLATMRFSYVQNLQEKLNQEQKRLEQDLLDPELTAAMKKRYDKQLTTIISQQVELIDFDKKLAELANQRIALDLDDGVVMSYEKLQRVLAKIK